MPARYLPEPAQFSVKSGLLQVKDKYRFFLSISLTWDNPCVIMVVSEALFCFSCFCVVNLAGERDVVFLCAGFLLPESGGKDG